MPKFVLISTVHDSITLPLKTFSKLKIIVQKTQLTTLDNPGPHKEKKKKIAQNKICPVPKHLNNNIKFICFRTS